jgi:hypothetical protein
VSYSNRGEEVAAADSRSANGDDVTDAPLREVFRNLTAIRLMRSMNATDRRW